MMPEGLIMCGKFEILLVETLAVSGKFTLFC